MEPWETSRGESAPVLPSGLHFAQPNRDIPPEMTRAHDATREILERNGESAEAGYGVFADHMRPGGRRHRPGTSMRSCAAFDNLHDRHG